MRTLKLSIQFVALVWCIVGLFSSHIIAAQESDGDSDADLVPGDKVIVIAPSLMVYAQLGDVDSVVMELIAGMTSRIVAIQTDSENTTWIYLDKYAHGWVPMFLNDKPTLTRYDAAVLQEMIAAATAQLDKDPNYIAALVQRGGAYEGLKNYEVGISDLDHAVELAPEDGRLYEYRANLLLDHGEYFAALQNYNRAILFGRNFAGNHMRVGIAHDNLWDLPEAQDYFQEAIRLNPDYGMGYRNMGTILIRQHKDDEAEVYLARAIEIDPYCATALVMRSTIYSSQGKNQEALADLNTAISIDPFLSEAYVERGILYDQGFLNGAVALTNFNNAIMIDSEDDQAFAARGIHYAFEGDWRLAAENLSYAVTLNPHNAHANYNLGFMLAHLGKYEDSALSFNKALQADSQGYALAFVFSAQLKIEMGEYEDATHDISLYLLQGRNEYKEITAYIVRAASRLPVEDFFGANDDLLSAMAIKTDFTRNYAVSGKNFLLLDGISRRIADLEAQLGSADEVTIRRELGAFYVEYGMWEQAAENYEHYRQLIDTPNPDLDALIDTLLDLAGE